MHRAVRTAPRVSVRGTLFHWRAGIFLLAALVSLSAAAGAAGDWLAQARALEQRQNWPALLRLGQSWSRSEPTNPLAWFVLGRAYTVSGQTANALAAYRKNLDLDPRDSHAATNLGNLHARLGQHRDALLAYRQAVHANPDYLLAWRNLGQTYYLLKGPPGVSQALQKLQATDPALARTWGALAATYALRPSPAVEQRAIHILAGLRPEQRERMFAILLADLP